MQEIQSVAKGPTHVKQEELQLTQRGVGVAAWNYPALQKLTHSEAVV